MIYLRIHHLLDPKTGLSAAKNLAISVTAPSAAVADGLSTACSAMGVAEIPKVVALHSDVGAVITDLDNEHIKIGDLPNMVTR